MQAFNINVEELLKEVFSNLFIGAFETSPLIFTSSERGKGGAFSKKLRQANSSIIISLNKPIYRKAFLYGCATFYYYLNDQNEWLIIGFGEKSGARTKINSYYIQQGDVNGVEVPTSIIEYVSNLIKKMPNSDVIFIHNHPPKPLRLLKNFIAGEIPIASTQDRHFAWRNKLETVFGLLGKKRFYLIENDLVKEFYLPSLHDVIAFFDQNTGSIEEKLKGIANQIIRRSFMG